MRLILIATLVALAGCNRDRAEVRTDPPPQAAEVIPVPVEVYVPIDPELRKRCPWVRTCKPSHGIACAKARADCLIQYENQLDGIDQVQGKPVPKGKP